jgi:hypothetical protein
VPGRVADSTKNWQDGERQLFAELAQRNRIVFDQAMFDDEQPVTINQLQVRGGIDFTAKNVDMQIESAGPGIHFNIDPAMLNNGNFDGLVPVILGVTPIQNLPLFLGSDSGAAPEKPLAFNTVDELLAIIDEAEVAV